MRKLISVFIVFGIIFGNIGIGFSEGQGETCKEEIIENATKPIISLNEKNYVYIIKDSDNQYYVVNDGNKGKKYSYINESDLYLSDDGSIYTYKAKLNNGKFIVVQNGIESEQYDSIKGFNFKNINFSDDKNHYVFIGNKGSSTFIIKDGKDYGPYEEVTGLLFSKDGVSFSFVVKKGDKFSIIKDGIIGEYYEKIYNNTIQYSLDGKNFVYLAKNANTTYIVKNGTSKKLNFEINYGKLDVNFLSPNGDFLFYTKYEGEYVDYGNGDILPKDPSKGYTIYKDGVKIGEGNTVIFSPDGKSYSYVLKDEKGDYYVYKDGIKLGIGNTPSYSPKGNFFVYSVYDKIEKKSYIVVNGKKGEKYDSLDYRIVYSLDEKEYSYIAGSKDDGYFVIKNGIAGTKYKNIDKIYYGVNSNEIVYLGEKNDMTNILVYEGKESKGTSIEQLITKGNFYYGTKYLFGFYTYNGKNITSIKEKNTSQNNKNIYNSFSIKKCGNNTIKNFDTSKSNNSTTIEKQDSTTKEIKTINTKNYSKQLILSKIRLNTTEKGKKYIVAIDTLVNKQNNEKLVIILKNIEKIKESILKNNNKDLTNIIEYIEAKIGVKLEANK